MKMGVCSWTGGRLERHNLLILLVSAIVPGDISLLWIAILGGGGLGTLETIFPIRRNTCTTAVTDINQHLNQHNFCNVETGASTTWHPTAGLCVPLVFLNKVNTVRMNQKLKKMALNLVLLSLALHHCHLLFITLPQQQCAYLAPRLLSKKNMLA